MNSSKCQIFLPMPNKLYACTCHSEMQYPTCGITRREEAECYTLDKMLHVASAAITILSLPSHFAGMYCKHRVTGWCFCYHPFYMLIYSLLHFKLPMNLCFFFNLMFWGPHCRTAGNATTYEDNISDGCWLRTWLFHFQSTSLLICLGK